MSQFEKFNVAVAGVLVELATIYPSSSQQMVNLEIVNAGAAALSDFKVQARDHSNGEWYDFLTAADFAGEPSDTMPDVSTESPASLAAGHLTHVVFRPRAAIMIRVMAQTAGAATTVSVRGMMT